MILKNKSHGCLFSNPFNYLEGILAHQVLMLRANQLEVIDYCWILQTASSSDTHVPQSTVRIPTHIICCAYSESVNCNRPHRPQILHHPDKFLSHESSYGLAFTACSFFPTEAQPHSAPHPPEDSTSHSPSFLRVCRVISDCNDAEITSLRPVSLCLSYLRNCATPLGNWNSPKIPKQARLSSVPYSCFRSAEKLERIFSTLQLLKKL